MASGLVHTDLTQDMPTHILDYFLVLYVSRLDPENNAHIVVNAYTDAGRRDQEPG